MEWFRVRRAPYLVTPYQGIQQRAGGSVEVGYAQGDALSDIALPLVPAQYLTPSSGSGRGLTGEYFSNMTLSGSPAATQNSSQIDFVWHGGSPISGVPETNWSARWTGTLTVPTTGTYPFSITSDDGSRLFIDGQEIIDNWYDGAPHTSSGMVALQAGEPVSIEVDYYQDLAGSSLSLGWQPTIESMRQDAVDLAESADVAIVFVSNLEAEGEDLNNIDLRSDANDLITAVAAANPNTIVVLNTGSAVTMPWLDQVKGVFEAWYPGQENGDAIAALLFGDVNPSGKLPVTFPKSLADVPASTASQWPGVGGTVEYSEGLEVGYRWYDTKQIQPLFPFGFGMSYTDFAFSHLLVHRESPRNIVVSADVTNIGATAGSEVVQLYIGDPPAAGEPPQQLKAFQKVALNPGRTERVKFHLGPDAFSIWDTMQGRWRIAAGEYEIFVGDSSDNLPLHATVRVAG
jgi:beta-glucosidase